MATIQTTQLEERETGDIKQLRDHDIAEGPVSTNSADATSLKSVPLTLEDGSIIKVRFDSLVTAIGQALGASEDSTVTKVLGLNGTVPKGIGMANLASVLGVPAYHGASNNLSDSFKADLYASFSAASNYSDFDGNSRRGVEGRWIGYRHTANQGQAIVLYGSSLYYCNISSASSGAFYQIV